MTDTCPTCGEALLPAVSNGRKALACIGCNYLRDVDMRPTKLKLPGLDPGRQSVYADRDEKEIVNCARAELMLLGYTVMRVGQRRADLAGTDEGCPDLYVTRPEWLGLWKAIETKTATGRARQAQKTLNAAGMTEIARSVEAVVRAAEATRARLEGLVRG